MSMECIFALSSAVNEGVRDHLVRPFTWGNGMLISPNKDEVAVNGCQIPMIWLFTGSRYCMAIPRSWYCVLTC